MTLVSVLKQCLALGATDLHLQVGANGCMRRAGKLQSLPIKTEIGWPAELKDLCKMEEVRQRIKDKAHRAVYYEPGETRGLKNILTANKALGMGDGDPVGMELAFRTTVFDGAFTFAGERWRVHLYSAQGVACATIRVLYQRFMELTDENGEMAILRSLVTQPDGLFLLTGPTGSGKSFTLASCLQYVNTHFAKHIITLEDPIEYVLLSQESLIHQRQLGWDIPSMEEGLREALREDPDIIMVGEIRSRDALEAAVYAAETGHLVLATLHTQRAALAVSRMVSMFEGARQEEVRQQLSYILRGIICQRLYTVQDKIVTAREILLNTTAVSNLIRQRKEEQILSVQETQRPMQTMEMAEAQLQKVWGDLWPKGEQELNETISLSCTPSRWKNH